MSDLLAHRVNAIPNAAEVIAQSLKEMIYSAELKPGQPLVQERIAEMFQVSRIPVRDALRLLVGMGIAISVPRRGVIVRPLSQAHLDDLFHIRQILEGAAIRIVARKATPELFQRLDALMLQQIECLPAGDIQRYARIDDEFHQAVWSVVGNAELVRLIRSNWEKIKQARNASVVVPTHGRTWMSASIERHKRIVAALRAGDQEMAYSTVLENIESSRHEIVSCLREMEWIETSNHNREVRSEPERARPNVTR